jgi:hypothetical protein
MEAEPTGAEHGALGRIEAPDPFDRLTSDASIDDDGQSRHNLYVRFLEIIFPTGS